MKRLGSFIQVGTIGWVDHSISAQNINPIDEGTKVEFRAVPIVWLGAIQKEIYKYTQTPNTEHIKTMTDWFVERKASHCRQCIINHEECLGNVDMGLKHEIYKTIKQIPPNSMLFYKLSSSDKESEHWEEVEISSFLEENEPML